VNSVSTCARSSALRQQVDEDADATTNEPPTISVAR
jgi:hypothetical protein